ncbi:hypothetical protein MKW92_031356 [Papaver armeniacum]|nr:hypothetical protein MKW92_031356 [Papaver armeniacum]
MASIRKMCFNDLLHMNDILMGQNYGSSLYNDILRDPEYALVAVSPSNRIMGFITACIQRQKRICVIAGIFGVAGLSETGDMLIQALMEKAEQLGEVDFVVADVSSNNQRFVNFFEKHGFTWDDEQPEGSIERLRKDLLPNTVSEAHDDSRLAETTTVRSENSGFSTPPTTSQ